MYSIYSKNRVCFGVAGACKCGQMIWCLNGGKVFNLIKVNFNGKINDNKDLSLDSWRNPEKPQIYPLILKQPKTLQDLQLQFNIFFPSLSKAPVAMTTAMGHQLQQGEERINSHGKASYKAQSAWSFAPWWCPFSNSGPHAWLLLFFFFFFFANI